MAQRQDPERVQRLSHNSGETFETSAGPAGPWIIAFE